MTRFAVHDLDAFQALTSRMSELTHSSEASCARRLARAHGHLGCVDLRARLADVNAATPRPQFRWWLRQLGDVLGEHLTRRLLSPEPEGWFERLCLSGTSEGPAGKSCEEPRAKVGDAALDAFMASVTEWNAIARERAEAGAGTHPLVVQGKLPQKRRASVPVKKPVSASRLRHAVARQELLEDELSEVQRRRFVLDQSIAVLQSSRAEMVAQERAVALRLVEAIMTRHDLRWTEVACGAAVPIGQRRSMQLVSQADPQASAGKASRREAEVGLVGV